MFVLMNCYFVSLLNVVRWCHPPLLGMLKAYEPRHGKRVLNDKIVNALIFVSIFRGIFPDPKTEIHFQKYNLFFVIQLFKVKRCTQTKMLSTPKWRCFLITSMMKIRSCFGPLVIKKWHCIAQTQSTKK